MPDTFSLLKGSAQATEGIGKDLLDQRRVFFSEEIIDCPLSYIVEKVSISQIPSGVSSQVSGTVAALFPLLDPNSNVSLFLTRRRSPRTTS